MLVFVFDLVLGREVVCGLFNDKDVLWRALLQLIYCK